MMFEFWKEHCHSEIIYNDIIEKTLHFNEVKEEATLEEFFT